ncbi:hypothetical protein BLNAU_8928 [Blattamonas nauphoetae]|uniref:Uncharacterized protein n=1 Tax=Blattamonas nauphoetae TaxID=2049346 RepID=A0ABQ9XXD0_9EUKA|nr:hypothetical protein BLNAU_8928 [Blattamonas nauphoetae]
MAVLDPCSISTHTLPLPSASPSPPTPSHSSLPLPHHPHPPTPLCLSLTPLGVVWFMASHSKHTQCSPKFTPNWTGWKGGEESGRKREEECNGKNEEKEERNNDGEKEKNIVDELRGRETKKWKTDPLDVIVREGRKKSEKDRKTGDETKRRKCTTLLLHVSPPVSTTAYEDWCRFWSLSPTTPQLMTSCPVTHPTVNPNCTRGQDEVAVG